MIIRLRLFISNAGDPIDIAYDLRTKYGVKIYAIGIGQSINRRELRLLVGQRNKGHVFQLANYNDIDKIIEGLIHRGKDNKRLKFIRITPALLMFERGSCYDTRLFVRMLILPSTETLLRFS